MKISFWLLVAAMFVLSFGIYKLGLPQGWPRAVAFLAIPVAFAVVARYDFRQMRK